MKKKMLEQQLQEMSTENCLLRIQKLEMEFVIESHELALDQTRLLVDAANAQLAECKTGLKAMEHKMSLLMPNAIYTPRK